MKLDVIKSALSQTVGISWQVKDPAQIIYDACEFGKAKKRDKPVTDVEHNKVCDLIVQRCTASTDLRRCSESVLQFSLRSQYDELLEFTRTHKQENRLARPNYAKGRYIVTKEGEVPRTAPSERRSFDFLSTRIQANQGR